MHVQSGWEPEMPHGKLASNYRQIYTFPLRACLYLKIQQQHKTRKAQSWVMPQKLWGATFKPFFANLIAFCALPAHWNTCCALLILWQQPGPSCWTRWSRNYMYKKRRNAEKRKRWTEKEAVAGVRSTDQLTQKKMSCQCRLLSFSRERNVFLRGLQSQEAWGASSNSY